MKYIGLILVMALVPVFGQDQFPESISDNSFLIEEAYNQEHRVVQHMFTFSSTRPAHDNEFRIAQEWPLFSHEHQISYSLPYAWLNKNSVRGMGDVSVDYRYQLFEKDRWAAVAPRLSMIIPTGNDKKELGSGALGYQFNLPVSKRMHAQWVMHVNAGGTVMPGVKSGTAKKTLWSGHAGAAVYWLWKPNLNFMLEWLSSFDDEFTAGGNIKNRAVHIINPGVRFALEAGPVQIVPGLCFPLQVNGKDKSKTALLYLSLEHPF